MPNVVLRDVIDEDLPIFFENQRDPEAFGMVGYASRDREAFDAHWARIRVEPSTCINTIVSDGRVAGSVASFERGGKREVGYWIGREFWGQGVATKALREHLRLDRLRPLHGVVLMRNAASQRVLEKCGFARAGEVMEPAADGSGAMVVLAIMRLDAAAAPARE